MAFRRDLYESVKAYSETVACAALEGERRRNVEFWMRDFRRTGQDLGAEDRSTLQELRSRLIELHVAFDRNINDWEDGIDMTREDLDGLVESYIERLSPGESEGSYRVSVEYPDYVPFMDQATNRDLRRQLQFKFLNRAAEANIPLLNEAVQVRWETANLLGFPNFADYAMEVKPTPRPSTISTRRSSPASPSSADRSWPSSRSSWTRIWGASSFSRGTGSSMTRCSASGTTASMTTRSPSTSRSTRW